ncbi:MAG: hypothetical protein CFH42_01913 [Alphaproteobacteria bacterium MarineAlpha12_Bin1]|jgi:rod shape-determining protein MreD|nr:MAG: hypothetical protein CFH42_01913 [Alphaproteobacteria bacterium MarineAlpha12_Bin1]|tara:strand:+ start:8472 stop:8996 length:525 start_codon:yes stop_codon:yes gene_type:complete
MNTLSIFLWLKSGLVNILPTCMTFLFVLIGYLPWPISFFAEIVPAFAIISLYYWVVFRPDLIPYFVVFGLGILQDAISGAPFGLHAIVYLVVRALVVNQRRFIIGKPFWVFWVAFGLVSFIAGLLSWCLASLYRGALLPTDAPLIALIMTVTLFPLIAWILLQVQRKIVGTMGA